MFRRDVKELKDLIMRNMRQQGLEMPLLQKRLVEAWPILNQTLYVHLGIPALRADLSLRRQEFTGRLNDYVGAQVIADVRFC